MAHLQESIRFHASSMILTCHSQMDWIRGVSHAIALCAGISCMVSGITKNLETSIFRNSCKWWRNGSILGPSQKMFLKRSVEQWKFQNYKLWHAICLVGLALWYCLDYPTGQRLLQEPLLPDVSLLAWLPIGVFIARHERCLGYLKLVRQKKIHCSVSEGIVRWENCRSLSCHSSVTSEATHLRWLHGIQR